MGEHKKEAKKVYSLARKEQRQTGGGPEIKLVTPAINRTIDLCRDSAAFNGIGGFQTSVNGNLCSFIHQFKLILLDFKTPIVLIMSMVSRTYTSLMLMV